MRPETPAPSHPLTSSHFGTRIPCLDGLRAYAIVLVILSHLRPTLPWEGASQASFLHKGQFGVAVFFLISGFLITHLLLREAAETGKVQLGAFYKRRICRILPAFYAYLGTLCVLTLLGVLHLNGKTLLNAASFITNYKHYWTPDDGPDYWNVGHFWTLSLEEQFYLFWPALFCLLGTRRAVWAAVSLVAMIQVARVLSYYLDTGSRGQINMMTHTSLDSIMVGCVLALLHEASAPEKIRRFLSSHWPLLLAAALWGLNSQMHLLLGSKHLYWVHLPGRLLNYVAIACLISWCVNHPRSLLGRVLEWRPLVFVGVLSYSLYLWQQLFLNEDNHAWYGRFPTNLLCTFAAALLSYYLVERPFLRLRKRWA